MIKLHPGQSQVYSDIFLRKLHRYETVNCSRGFGKSYLGAAAARTAVNEMLAMPLTIPNKLSVVMAPTFDQVMDIYYPILAYDMGLEDLSTTPAKSTGKFKFKNNSELRLMSYESVERLRGKGIYFLVWDEVSSCKKGMSPASAWESVIQPCIATRWSPKFAREHGLKNPGRALMLSTPEGYNDFYDFCMMHKEDNDWGYTHYNYLQSPNLDPDEIEKIKRKLDPIRFASEYMADFKESGNSVFYMFDRDVHERDDLPYFLDDEIVHAAIDFNVGRMHTSFSAIRGGQIQILDEMEGAPNTEKLCEDIRVKFGNRKIIAYPDPTGRARKTSAAVGITDFRILRNAGFEVRARRASPPIVDSANAVNAQLMNARGDINLFVSSKCKGVLGSLERTVWSDRNLDVAAIDKSQNEEHYSDGIRYFVEMVYPVTAPRAVVQGHDF